MNDTPSIESLATEEQPTRHLNPRMAWVAGALAFVLSALALFFFGGDVIHDFSFTMLVGVVFGTYSSVFVASALALDTQLWLERRGKKK